MAKPLITQGEIDLAIKNLNSSNSDCYLTLEKIETFEGQKVKWLKLNSCPKDADIVFKRKRKRVVKPDTLTVIWKDKKGKFYGCCEYDWS